MSPGKTRRGEGRTGVTSRTSGRGRTAATPRAQPAAPRPAQQSQERSKVKCQERHGGGGAVPLRPLEPHVSFTFKEKNRPFVLPVFAHFGMAVSSGLVASVQSLVAILQQQVDTSSHQQTPADSQTAATLQNLPTDNVMHFDP